MITASIAKLHRLLQQAMEVELFTIPPYLTALYSIVEGTNRPSVAILQSVVMEEMLHAGLVANIMNRVKATPVVRPGDDSPQRGRFPAVTPHIEGSREIGLLAFSPAAIDNFIAIERPEDPDQDWSKTGAISTIGQLYANLRNALVAACEDVGASEVFSGEVRQLEAGDYYGGGGQLSRINDLEDALAAIDVISQQGEGRVRVTNLTGDEVRFSQPKEVAHYYRFEQIRDGRFYDLDNDFSGPGGARLPVDWAAVRTIASYPPEKGAVPGLDALLEAFDTAYGGLLEALHLAFNGDPEAMGRAVPMMHRLKYQAIELMRIDVGDGRTCPPPFWFIQS